MCERPTQLPTPAAATPIGTNTLAPAPTPTATAASVLNAFRGTYDLNSESNLRDFTSHAVALVDTPFEGGFEFRFEFDAFNEIDVHGTLNDQGFIALTGFGIFQADIWLQVAGQATVGVVNGVQRIEGSLHNSDPDSSLQFDLAFVMERPASGTPPVLTGRYTVDFETSPSGCGCVSRSILDLDVPPTGLAHVLRAARDLDRNGALVGIVEPGDCLISPSGRLQCVLEYLRVFEPPADQFPPLPTHFLMTLTGQLDASGGSGRTDVDPFTSLFAGRWTSTR